MNFEKYVGIPYADTLKAVDNTQTGQPFQVVDPDALPNRHGQVRRKAYCASA